jgi:hypothetical protein
MAVHHTHAHYITLHCIAPQSMYKKGTTLIETEALMDRGVGFETYKYQLSSFGGSGIVVVTLFTLVFSQLCIVAGNFLIAIWSEKTWDETDLWYMTVYIILAVVTFMGLCGRSLLLKLISVKSATFHHERVLDGVLHAPVGRILNRFSTDMRFADLHAVRLLIDVTGTMINYLTAMLAVLFVTWYFAIPLFIAILCNYGLQKIYKDAAVQYQRIFAVAKSPQFQHFSTTLLGLSTYVKCARARVCVCVCVGVREHTCVHVYVVAGRQFFHKCM